MIVYVFNNIVIYTQLTKMMNYSDKIIDVSNTFCALYVFNKVIHKVSFCCCWAVVAGYDKPLTKAKTENKKVAEMNVCITSKTAQNIM